MAMNPRFFYGYKGLFDAFFGRFSSHLFSMVFVGLLSSAFYSPLFAQRADSLKRELTVISDHEAIIESKMPPEAKFIFEEPKVTRLSPMTPRPTRDFTPAVVIPKHPLLGDHATRLNFPSKVGFLSLQGGLTPNLLVDGGLQLPLGDRHALFLDASHRSSWYWAPYERRISSRVQHHFTEAALAYSYRNPQDRFAMGVDFAHEAFGYFGLYLPTNEPSDLISNQKVTSPLRVNEFYTLITADYTHQNDRTLLVLDLDADLQLQKSSVNSEKKSQTPLRKWGVALEAKYDLLLGSRWHLGVISQTDFQISRSFASGIKEAYTPEGGRVNSSYSFYSELLTPYLGVEGFLGRYPWHFAAGARIGFYGYRGHFNRSPNPGLQPRLLLSPYVDFDLTFNKYIGLFGNVGGGTHIPDRFGDDMYNRFIAPGYPLYPEIYRLSSEVGFEVNAGYGFFFALSGGYHRIDGKNYLRARFVQPEFEDESHSSFIAFEPFRADSRIVFAKVEARYELFEKLSLATDFTYKYIRTIDTQSIPEGINPLEWNFSAGYTPLRKLSLYADIFFGWGARHSYPSSDTEFPDKLSYLYLSLGASYRITTLFSLHASLGSSALSPTNFPFAYHDRYMPVGVLVGASLLF